MDHAQADLDFLAFSVCALFVFAGLHLGLWLKHRQSGLPRLVWPRVVALAGGAVVTDRIASQTTDRLVRGVIGFAPTYALEMTRYGHAQINPATRPDDPTYLALIDAQKRWLAVNPAVNDIHTFRSAGTDRVHLIVDSETDYDHNGRFEGEREARTDIGEVLDLGGMPWRTRSAARAAWTPSPPPNVGVPGSVPTGRCSTRRGAWKRCWASTKTRAPRCTRDGPRSPARDGVPFELVIRDSHPPKSDGLELAGRIQCDPALRHARVLMPSSVRRHVDTRSAYGCRSSR